MANVKLAGVAFFTALAKREDGYRQNGGSSLRSSVSPEEVGYRQIGESGLPYSVSPAGGWLPSSRLDFVRIRIQ